MTSISGAQALSAWFVAFDRDSAAVSRTSPDSIPSPSDDLIDGMVGMQSDAIGVRAAIQAVRSQDEMLGSILDLLA